MVAGRPHLKLYVGGEEWEAERSPRAEDCWIIPSDFRGDPDEICWDCGWEFGCHRGADKRWPE